MIITCPNCGTTFNLPDDKVSPEHKARCAVCRHVFQLAQGMPGASDNRFLSPDAAPASAGHEVGAGTAVADETATQGKKKKGGSKKASVPLLIGAVVAILVLLAAIWFFVLRDTTGGGETGAKADQELARRVEEIAIDKRRQRIMENTTLGKILVIEGEVTNMGDSPKHYIQLEASLIDPEGGTFMHKPFYCGTQLSDSQLQTMGEAGIETRLSDSARISYSNTAIPRGGRVPFMVVFYRLPQEMLESPARYSYRLTVIDALEKLPSAR